MSEIKRQDDLLQKLKSKGKMAWDFLTEQDREQVSTFAQKYIDFLNIAKTEREAVQEILNQAREQKFKDIFSQEQDAGGRFYQINRDKNIALCSLGREDIRQGIRFIISHIDSPRLDLKPSPLYEEQSLALLHTHYYGGIKKYHWVALPLALHGVVVRCDGSKIEFRIGEKPQDPVFTISDLLPHLSQRIMNEKKLKDAVEGEKLTILFGHQPLASASAAMPALPQPAASPLPPASALSPPHPPAASALPPPPPPPEPSSAANHQEEKERIKSNILCLLHEQYGIVEDDFISAEIEAVPALPARSVGLDRSMIGGYGQDDRICAYTSLQAILAQTDPPRHTSLVLFVDKEETGSDGNTGAQSRFVEMVVGQLLRKAGIRPEEQEQLLREILFCSKALSADVNAGFDPNYPEVFEKHNACHLGYGINLCKYVGSRGKYSTNDASAEYMGEIRKLFNENGVIWQAKELGKVDEGGGGTIAKFLAKYGLDMVDCGPPILGMHSPFEIASKADLYETFKAYRAFLEKS
jgi:aspartyl aminopeptidase